MAKKDIDFEDILSAEIEICRKLKCPTWIILFQIERKEDTVFKKKSSQTQDWVEQALKDIKQWTGMVKQADLYGHDKIAVIPNASSDLIANDIAKKIANQLTFAKQKYDHKVLSSDLRQVVFGIVNFDPMTNPDKTTDTLLEEAIELLWQNRLN